MCSCKVIVKIILGIISIFFVLAEMLKSAFDIVAFVKWKSNSVYLNVVPEIGFGWIIGPVNIGVIFLGGILIVVVAALAFVGCCGTCCLRKGLPIVCILVQVLVLCGEIARIILVAVALAKLEATIQDLMKKSQDQFNEDITFANGTFKMPNNTTSLEWTVFQLESKCCGTNNYTDYKNWPHNVTFDGKTYVAQVPASCCTISGDFKLGSSDTSESVFVNVTECLNGNNEYINQKNCYDSIYDRVRTSSNIDIGIAAAIIGLQLLMFIFLGVLSHQQKNDVEQMDCEMSLDVDFTF